MEIVPRQGFLKKPDGTFAAQSLDNMAPFLSEAEMQKCMVVRKWEG